MCFVLNRNLQIFYAVFNEMNFKYLTLVRLIFFSML